MIQSVLELDAVRELGAAGRLVATHLAESGSGTYEEIAAATGVSSRSVSHTVKALIDAGLVRTETKQNVDRGRPPTVAIATGDLARIDDGPRDLEAEVITVLALSHYERGLSAQKSKRIADEVGISTAKAANVLRDLYEEGIVDKIETSSRNWYRLAAPGEYSPFYAPQDQEAEA